MAELCIDYGHCPYSFRVLHVLFIVKMSKAKITRYYSSPSRMFCISFLGYQTQRIYIMFAVS